MSKVSMIAYVVGAAFGAGYAATSTPITGSYGAALRLSCPVQVYPTSVYNDSGVKATQQRRKALIKQHALNRVKKAKNASKHLKGKAVKYKLR